MDVALLNAEDFLVANVPPTSSTVAALRYWEIQSFESRVSKSEELLWMF